METKSPSLMSPACSKTADSTCFIHMTTYHHHLVLEAEQQGNMNTLVKYKNETFVHVLFVDIIKNTKKKPKKQTNKQTN